MSLEGVKVGDSIIVSARGCRAIAVVERVTKLHVHCGTARYSIRNGKLAGTDSWSYTVAEPSTPELLKEVRAENRHRRLVYGAVTAWRNFRPDEASNETLNSLIELLTAESM